MVINIGRMISRQFDYIESELRQMADTLPSERHPPESHFRERLSHR